MSEWLTDVLFVLYGAIAGYLAARWRIEEYANRFAPKNEYVKTKGDLEEERKRLEGRLKDRRKEQAELAQNLATVERELRLFEDDTTRLEETRHCVGRGLPVAIEKAEQLAATVRRAASAAAETIVELEYLIRDWVAATAGREVANRHARAVGAALVGVRAWKRENPDAEGKWDTLVERIAALADSLVEAANRARSQRRP